MKAKPRLRYALGGVALIAAGLVAALSLAAAAHAYAISDLPGLGYSVGHVVDTSPPPGTCAEAYNVAGFGSSIHLETCDSDFQQKLDAFVAATCPCAQTTATSSPPATTTPPPTETAPPPPSPPGTTTVVAALPAPPFADFTATANGAAVSLTDTSTSSSPVASRVWQFGDGTAGTGGAVNHPYAAGTYYVTLIVVDANGLTSLAVHELTVASDRSIALGPRTTQAVVPSSAASAGTHRTIDVRNGDIVRVNGDKLRCVVQSGVVICGLPPGKGGVWAYITRSAVIVARATKSGSLVTCLHHPAICKPG